MPRLSRPAVERFDALARLVHGGGAESTEGPQPGIHRRDRSKLGDRPAQLKMIVLIRDGTSRLTAGHRREKGNFISLFDWRLKRGKFVIDRRTNIFGVCKRVTVTRTLALQPVDQFAYGSDIFRDGHCFFVGTNLLPQPCEIQHIHQATIPNSLNGRKSTVMPARISVVSSDNSTKPLAAAMEESTPAPS